MAINDNKDMGAPGSNDRKSAGLLPRYFRTSANKKFLQATLDQMISEGRVERLSGYIGKKTTPLFSQTDRYIPDVSAEREWYKLDPAIVIKDSNGNVTSYKDYRDYINCLRYLSNGEVNESRANSQEMYSWDPMIDWDKFANYRDYYWMPSGPKSVTVRGVSENTVSEYTVSLKVTDGIAGYVFTPDSLTVNPTIKLYRGQTYRFSINSPGHPITFRTDNGVMWSDGISEQGIENGVIEFTIPMNSPNVIYYVSENDPATGGMFTLYNASEAAFLDVEADIIGKKSYSNGDVVFENGLRVKFAGNVVPEKYASSTWYVEGVGDKIALVNHDDLFLPTSFSWGDDVPFDSDNFDTQGFEMSSGLTLEKEYITINRASQDRNKWSRSNRWFHSSVILAADPETRLDPSKRANRPIIEFNAGLVLWNHGTLAKTDVDFVDSVTTDVFSTLEGNEAIVIDGKDVFDGARVLFLADISQDVMGKVFVVRKFKHEGVTRYSFVPSEDSNAIDGDCVLVRSGDFYKGKMFHYVNGLWSESQNKQKTNQFPLFDVFDNDGVSLSDEFSYMGSTFVGTTLFQYASGYNVDPVLQFGVKYKNVNNIGDLVFDFTLNSQTFQYQTTNGLITQPVSAGFIKQVTPYSEEYKSGWVKTHEGSFQYIVQQYVAETQFNFFEINCIESPTDLTEADVRVFQNGSYKTALDFGIFRQDGRAFIQLFEDAAYQDSIVIKVKTDKPKVNGFYEIPDNLEKNPFNENVSELTLGEVTAHARTISETIIAFDQLPKDGVLRNRGNVSAFGKKIVQHSSSLVPVMYHITNKKHNVIRAIQFAKSEYAKFKNNFLRVATDLGFDGEVSVHVDKVLQTMVAEKNQTMPFYFSDMIPFGAKKVQAYQVADTSINSFPLQDTVDLSEKSMSAVLVYMNGKLLTKNVDYNIEDGFCEINNVEVGSVVIEIYRSTYGSYIPQTPTKLGLYPSFVPEKFLDTTYIEPMEVIRGHDGSITAAFGDYRDDLILELETRIYNNLKVKYDPEMFDIHDYVGGEFRDTGIKKSEIDAVLFQDFLKWARNISLDDFTQPKFYDTNNARTYNYGSFNSYTGSTLPGFWRGIFNHFYDTTTPNMTPWEMMGISEKPAWWESTYGPAPYTSNNSLLWEDLETGTIRYPEGVVVNKKYARPGLTDHLPVDERGDLLDPLAANLVDEYSKIKTTGAFKFGDESPYETAWRRSSDFAYSLINALVLLRPAKMFAVCYDRIRQVRDQSGQLVYRHNNDTRFDLRSAVLPEAVNGEYTVTSGLVNWIAEYSTYKLEQQLESFKFDVANINVQLGSKLAGYTSKEKFKLLLENQSPSYAGSSLIPEENYHIFLNTSSPIKSVIYSGVIVEKSNNGFVIKGYSPEKYDFDYFAPLETASDRVVNVGGISEAFSEWTANQYYERGVLVRYGNEYYRVVTSHKTPLFDAKYFVRVATLPITGGQSAIIRTRFENVTSKIAYGTTFETIQEVVDFLLGYGEYLTSIGFVFDYHNELINSVNDWRASVNEFLFWTTQNWGIGSAISLSPASNELKFVSEYSVVDNLLSNDEEYTIMMSTGQVLEPSFTNSLRDDNTFTLRPHDTLDGIYHAQLNLVQKEHVVIVDNRTIFNDVIFDAPQGTRRDRLMVSGYKTSNWTGGFTIPGMVYDQAIVTNWEPWGEYAVGDVVKHKEFYYSAKVVVTGKENFVDAEWNKLQSKPESKLIPNWDYRAGQFEDFYELETDSFDEQHQRFAQHTVGYQPRDYMANIIPNEVAQYKFYLGMIREKGTLNSLEKLFGPLQKTTENYLEFYEEWAFRLGQYGATATFAEFETSLDESKFRLNPQPFELVDAINEQRLDNVYQLSSNDYYVCSDNVSKNQFPIGYDVKNYLPTAGYVKESDVKYTVKDIKDVLQYEISDFKVGDYVWVGKSAREWDVKRFTLFTNNVYSLLEGDDELNVVVTFMLPIEGQIKVGDVIAIDTLGYAADQLVEVIDVEYDKVVVRTNVKMDLNNLPTNYKQFTRVFVFTSQRVKNFSDVAFLPYSAIKDGELLWVDGNNDADWSVWKYTPNTYSEVISQTGNAIAASKNGELVAVAANGTVSVYKQHLPVAEITSDIEEFAKNIVFAGDSLIISGKHAVCEYRYSEDQYVLQNVNNFDGVVSQIKVTNQTVYVLVDGEVFAFDLGSTAASTGIQNVHAIATNDTQFAYSILGDRVVVGDYTVYGDEQTFGDKIALLSDSRVAILIPETGEVVVSNGTTQTVISKPQQASYVEDIAVSGTTVLIKGTSGAETVNRMFDEGTTIFDYDSTTFNEEGLSSNVVYVYTEVDGNFAFNVVLQPNEESDNFASSYIVADAMYATLNEGIVKFTINPVWSKLREQTPVVDVRKIKTSFLYDTVTKRIVQRLDCVDPLRGKILGIADKEITFKTSYDPAVYTEGTEEKIVDSSNFWAESYVGKLWWDIGGTLFNIPYQDSVLYRSNAWGSTFMNSEVAVYEWVKSKYLPSEWNELSGTEEGATENISGEAVFGDENISITSKYDSQSETFTNTYYYWVKNPVYVPQTEIRTISASDVANLIQDPKSTSEKYIQFTGPSSFSLVNCADVLRDNNVALTVQYMTVDVSDAVVHSHYTLLADGDVSSMIPKELERKWFDSLIGSDINGRQVPDQNLPDKVKYGIMNTPMQGMFVNRFEALNQVIERVNRVLSKRITADKLDIERLTKKSLPPSTASMKYDIVVDSIDELEFITLENSNNFEYQPAVLEPVIDGGKVVAINVTSSGKGYGRYQPYNGSESEWYGPMVSITSDKYVTPASAVSIINSNGEIIRVEMTRFGQGYESATVEVRPLAALVNYDKSINGRWAIYNYDNERGTWARNETQQYNIEVYWKFIDWYADDITPFDLVKYEVDFPYELENLPTVDGDKVRVNFNGNSGWAWYEKTLNEETGVESYQLVAQQNGTIEFSDSLYQYTVLGIGYDSPIFDNVPYDNTPDAELRTILEVIRDNLFVDDLQVEFNKLFFSSIRYVFSEQVFVDWAFKTSFVRSTHRISDLSQPKLYKKDNLSDYEAYVNEVKPYRTKVREFTTAFSDIEVSNTGVSDFDLPPTITNGEITSVQTSIVNGLLETSTQPTEEMQAWLSNVGSPIEDIEISFSGNGYVVPPIIEIVGTCVAPATAKAYISNGKITKVVLTNAGEGYLETPTVVVDGSVGYEGTPAVLKAVLGKGVVRSTSVEIKFDRVTNTYERTNKTVRHTLVPFTTRQRLPVIANTDLSTISVVVNGVEQISSEFTLENITETVQGVRSEYALLTLQTVPSQTGVSYVVYEMNDELLTAADRIYHYYEPLPGMPGKDLEQLMIGSAYGGVRVDGTDSLVEEREYDVKVDGNGFTPTELKTIIDGGKFTSVIDCPSVEELVPGKIFESVRVTYENVSMFKSMFEEYVYTEMPSEVIEEGTVITNQVFLARDLGIYDEEIEVTDASSMVDPAGMNLPGTIFINGERIEYRGKVGNTLLNIHRGTGGTSIGGVYPAGTVVEDTSYVFNAGVNDTVLVDQQTLTVDGDYVFINLEDFNVMCANKGWDHDTNYGQCNDVSVMVNGKKLSKAEYTVIDNNGNEVTKPAEYDVAVNPGEHTNVIRVNTSSFTGDIVVTVIKKIAPTLYLV